MSRDTKSENTTFTILVSTVVTKMGCLLPAQPTYEHTGPITLKESTFQAQRLPRTQGQKAIVKLCFYALCF